MQRQNPYTQRMIERTIRAALSCGLHVVGIRPDGTVLTDEQDKATTTTGSLLTAKPKLRDAREKLSGY